jgi:hypothetical protein
VDVVTPPTREVAIGFITSDPIPLAHRIGIKLARTAQTVISFGRSRAQHLNGGLLNTGLGKRATRRGRWSSDSCGYTTITTSVSTAVPNSAM